MFICVSTRRSNRVNGLKKIFSKRVEGYAGLDRPLARFGGTNLAV
jgi:hypothetical protein